LTQPGLPEKVEVLIEVPRGGLIKRRGDGRIDYVSPIPCPFNYGCVPESPGDDGDPLDALVLGPRISRGHRGIYPVLGVVGFIDGGLGDRKLVCGNSPLTARQRHLVVGFFEVYARLKSALNRLRGIEGKTAFLSFETVPC
jgi:inorganic pyrophosphatase